MLKFQIDYCLLLYSALAVYGFWFSFFIIVIQFLKTVPLVFIILVMFFIFTTAYIFLLFKNDSVFISCFFLSYCVYLGTFFTVFFKVIFIFLIFFIFYLFFYFYFYKVYKYIIYIFWFFISILIVLIFEDITTVNCVSDGLTPTFKFRQTYFEVQDALNKGGTIEEFEIYLNSLNIIELEWFKLERNIYMSTVVKDYIQIIEDQKALDIFLTNLMRLERINVPFQLGVEGSSARVEPNINNTLLEYKESKKLIGSWRGLADYFMRNNNTLISIWDYSKVKNSGSSFIATSNTTNSPLVINEVVTSRDYKVGEVRLLAVSTFFIGAASMFVYLSLR